ncbi:hypothetical protein HOE04_00655 [archaeon]|nr:hypothetical protein [archaeon]
MECYVYPQIKRKFKGDQIAIINDRTGFLRCDLNSENFKDIVQAMDNPPKRIYLGVNYDACERIHDLYEKGVEGLDEILLERDVLE